jgi:hypothetical protein
MSKVFLYYTTDNDPGEGVTFSCLKKAQKYHSDFMKDIDCTTCFDEDDEEACLKRGCICHINWEKSEIFPHIWRTTPYSYFRIAETEIDPTYVPYTERKKGNNALQKPV